MARQFVPVNNADGLAVAENRYNTTTFDEVTTTRLRLEIDSDGTYSTGILEWKVYDSGNSPEFPPTVVAGVDRVVMQGGKTHLHGKVQTLSVKDARPRVRWTKDAGSGRGYVRRPGSAGYHRHVLRAGQLCAEADGHPR